MATSLKSRIKIKHKIAELFPVLAKNNVSVIERLADLIYDSQNKQPVTIRLIRYKKQLSNTDALYFTALHVDGDELTDKFPYDYRTVECLFHTLQIRAIFEA